MTRMQEVAYSSPCFEVEETIHPRFDEVVRHEGFVLSVKLTINVGLE